MTDPAWSSAGAGTQPANPPSNGANGIWDMIYGDDNANIVPKDIHMVESLVPRSGLPGPTAAVDADPFNGHEWNTAFEDLQYACIARLPTPKPCPCDPTTSTFAACEYLHPNDCCSLSYSVDGEGNANSGGDYDKPLCQNPAGGTAPETTQYWFKGYPGLREMAVLHGYATSPVVSTQGNSIVASICPKDLTSVNTSPGYGYNPAVAALINRLKEKLKGSCLPRPLTVNADGTLPCAVVEVISTGSIPPNQSYSGNCTAYCQAMGRDMASPPTTNADGSPNPAMAAAVLDSMRQSQICDANGTLACSDMCLCTLAQEGSTDSSGNNPGGATDLAVCQDNNDGSQDSLPPGYCYVDPANGDGNNLQIVANCPETQRRILRFVGNNPSGGGHPVPLPGSFVFTACQGSALGSVVGAAIPVADAGAVTGTP